jgi:hypothetical protein
VDRPHYLTGVGALNDRHLVPVQILYSHSKESTSEDWARYLRKGCKAVCYSKRPRSVLTQSVGLLPTVAISSCFLRGVALWTSTHRRETTRTSQRTWRRIAWSRRRTELNSCRSQPVTSSVTSSRYPRHHRYAAGLRCCHSLVE